MKRGSQTPKTKQSASNTEICTPVLPPAAKRCKFDADIFETKLTPEREMIIRTFYQTKKEGTAVLSKRAQEEFETQLKAIYRPDWETPFREELFDVREDMDPKTLMKIKDQKERQARVLHHLLQIAQRNDHEKYGDKEIQFLIDHLCCSVYDDPNTYFETLKMVEILADIYGKTTNTNECKDEFGGPVNLWWKIPATHVRADTKVYHCSLTLDQQVEWIKYYEEQWTHWHSDDPWFSFLLAAAEACFFRQRFIDAKGSSGYLKFHKRS